MIFEVDSLAADLNGRPVLRDLNFKIETGERIVLLGVNGCGKTTLLKMLNGLLEPTAGQIRYGGEALTAKTLGRPDFRRRFRSEVGLLFQNVDAMLFNPTVADEIAFGPRQLGAANVDAAVDAQAAAFKLTDLLGRPPFELSGGEKKRVAMAAILAMNPRVLLLDEPTASLDPAWSGRLVDHLQHLTDVTVLTSTHNLTVAEELGGRALLLAPGRAGLLFDGPTAELLANEQLLIESGLAHRHVHRHHGAEHAHYHLHDTE
jgi:cobalt/nickel transport system ATP-binding protein